jgi:DNA-binding transcriptional regulator YiaG
MTTVNGNSMKSLNREDFKNDYGPGGNMVTPEDIRMLRERKYPKLKKAASRAKLAKLFLRSPRTIIAWERGDRHPNGLDLQKIIKMLDKTP